mgnify:CR=1 FL=1
MKRSKEADFWNDPTIVKEFYNHPPAPYWKHFLGSIKNIQKIKILDLGCGAGRNTEFIASAGFDIWACDAHAAMVNTTKIRLTPLLREKTEKRIVCSNMLKLPFPDNFFDIIIAHGLYHNAYSVSEFKKAINESARILKDGGFLCVNVFIKTGNNSMSVRATNKKSLFLTKEGLRMVLLTPKEILKTFKTNKLLPENEPILYETTVNTGRRSVFRCIFRKLT